MSKYHKPQQRSFDDIEVGMSSLSMRPKSFEMKFREVCDRVIPDSIFDKLYSNVGREARSPSVLTRLLLLQLREGVGDEKIVDDLYYDMRVRYMCDFGLEQKPIHPTHLVYHRLRLLFGTIKRDEIVRLKSGGFSEKDSPLADIFDLVKKAAVELGLVDMEAAQLIDSTAILGRGAVMDSYALIFAGIRKVLVEYGRSDDEHARELIGRLHRSEYLEDVAKPKIDWESDTARQELLNDLVCDAVSVLRAGLKFQDSELEGLVEQLARVVGQNVEVSEDGTGKLLDGVSSDRQISVVDPDMRHGRKSKSRKFNGYKGTVTADASSGVITAVHLMRANEHDSVAVADIIEAHQRGGTLPPALVGDRAYAVEEARYEAMRQGVAIVTKPNTLLCDGFGKNSFEMDAVGETITCPGGVVRPVGGKSVTFTGSRCPSDCAHREVCLGKSGKHVIKIRRHEVLQRDAESFAGTQRGKEMLRPRPAIERVIAHWMQNGGRQARYFGRLKVWMQCVLSAMMCNVHKIAGKAGDNGRRPLGSGSSTPILAPAVILSAISALLGVSISPNQWRGWYDNHTTKTLRIALSSEGF